jgi:hypothetical protein
MSTTRPEAGSCRRHIVGVVEAVPPVPMFGQLLEWPPGAVEDRGAVVVVPGLVDVVDVAALAIAAPPPITAPVTARVARSGFGRTFHLRWFDPATIPGEHLSLVGRT